MSIDTFSVGSNALIRQQLSAIYDQNFKSINNQIDESDISGLAIDTDASSIGVKLPLSEVCKHNSKTINAELEILPALIASLYFTVELTNTELVQQLIENEQLWRHLTTISQKLSGFIVLSCQWEDYQSDPAAFKALVQPWIKQAKLSGFKGVILSCSELPSYQRLEVLSRLGEFLLMVQGEGLECGILGGLQPPDIPRLLPFTPNYLGFYYHSLSQDNKSQITQVQNVDSWPPQNMADGVIHDEGELALVRSSLPAKTLQVDQIEAMPEDLGTDKILVSDFIVPVHIGAYRHEKGKPQSVSFNVCAEITRTSYNPHNMSHIFSYDIILDAITRLASQDHVELVETLAEQVAAFILEFPRVRKVTVRVEKLDLAPRAVGIEITRCSRR